MTHPRDVLEEYINRCGHATERTHTYRLLFYAKKGTPLGLKHVIYAFTDEPDWMGQDGRKATFPFVTFGRPDYVPFTNIIRQEHESILTVMTWLFTMGVKP